MWKEDPGYFKSDVPEGRSSEWIVERFVVRDDGDYDPDKDERPDCGKRRPGRYTQLKRGSTVFMTDLYDEWWTQRVAIRQACRRGGHVLITGLGLGLVAESVLRAPACPVERITVLEHSPDVIRLVGPHLEARYGERLRIRNADAFTWEPAVKCRFSVVWHDIWPEPYDLASEMDRLRKRYRESCDWQGFWPREYLSAYGMLDTREDAGAEAPRARA